MDDAFTWIAGGGEYREREKIDFRASFFVLPVCTKYIKVERTKLKAQRTKYKAPVILQI